MTARVQERDCLVLVIPVGKQFLKLKMNFFWGLVRRSENVDGLRKMSLWVTHDASAPG